ncbi:MAG: hypothetical protein LBU05_06570 [Bifidobacteriaceae bacterium]|jgi:hypothetical protein|nr:hypothetical protein [Bifidobacteriaceae bacterium]
MSERQALATWVFMMLTAVRQRLGMPVSEFTGFALKHGLIRFLFANHGLLRYYDNDYIVDDTLRFLEDQGVRLEVDAS